jgi:hypothetical protein
MAECGLAAGVGVEPKANAATRTAQPVDFHCKFAPIAAYVGPAYQRTGNFCNVWKSDIRKIARSGKWPRAEGWSMAPKKQ